MFRRSKIKITPKIPQTKPNVDRVNESLSHIQSPNLCVSNTSVENESTKQQENKVSEPLTVKPPEPASITAIKSKDSVPMVDLTTPQSVERQPSVNEQHNEKQITLTTLIEPADESPGPSESSPNLEQDISQDKMSPQKSPQKDNASSTSIPNEQLSNDSPVSSLALSSVDRVQRTTGKLVASDTDKSKTQTPSTNSTISSSSKAAPAALIRDKCHVDPIKPRKRIKLTPKDLLDRSSITLYHLIHAPMSRAKRTDKRKAKEKQPDESTDENVEKNPNPKDAVQLDASKVINEDTMDSTITTASSVTTIITSELGADETTEKETIGPRVKVGPDGQLIIDEESLVIKKPKPIETQTIEEPINGKTTYASFRKRAPTARWSKAETIEFYTALNLIGPDFSLMSNLFFSGKRSRTDLKNKFRRENKLNKTVIEKALYEADVEYCLAQEAVQVEQS